MSCNFNGPRLNSPDVSVETAELAYGQEPLTFHTIAISGGQRVRIQVAQPGYWLLRVWITSTPEVTHTTVLPGNLPANLSASTFFKTTDEHGVCDVDILDNDPSQWYVQASVCGVVAVSPPIVIGI